MFVLHRKRPAGGCLVGAGTDEGELAGVPATLDDLVLVFGDDDAGQLTHQVTCARARHVTSHHTQCHIKLSIRSTVNVNYSHEPATCMTKSA